MIEVRTEAPKDAEGIRKLLDIAFGSDRHRKTVYRLREGVLPIRNLCMVAEYMGELRGSLRFWPICISPTDHASASDVPALLLGPLAIDPGIRGRGTGISLMETGLELAKDMGHTRVILVGDPEYYGQFGFVGHFTKALSLPGPVEQDRFLGLELEDGAFDGVSGLVTPALPGVKRAANEETQDQHMTPDVPSNQGKVLS